MADDKTDRAAEHGPRDPVPNPAGESPIVPSLGSGAPDAMMLQDLGAESAGDPGSDDSPRGHPGNTAAGGIINSGPTDPGFTGSEEYASRAQATESPGRDAESGVPAKESGSPAPGNNLAP